MKKALFLLVVLLAAHFGFSQSENIEEEEVTQTFVIVEKMPLFNGASDHLESQQKVKDFIAERVQSANLDITGTVYVSYVIDTDGSLIRVKLLKGISEEPDQVAISIINQLTNWTPGSQRGRLVEVMYTEAVKFIK